MRDRDTGQSQSTEKGRSFRSRNRASRIFGSLALSASLLGSARVGETPVHQPASPQPNETTPALVTPTPSNVNEGSVLFYATPTSVSRNEGTSYSKTGSNFTPAEQEARQIDRRFDVSIDSPNEWGTNNLTMLYQDLGKLPPYFYRPNLHHVKLTFSYLPDINPGGVPHYDSYYYGDRVDLSGRDYDSTMPRKSFSTVSSMLASSILPVFHGRKVDPEVKAAYKILASKQTDAAVYPPPPTPNEAIPLLVGEYVGGKTNFIEANRKKFSWKQTGQLYKYIRQDLFHGRGYSPARQ